jgi:hypothetical protein
VIVDANTANTVANGSVLTAHDFKNCLALSVVRAFVDDRKNLTTPLVDRPGPLENADHGQAIEPCLPVFAGVDLNCSNGVAMPLVGKRIELAVAAIFAVAIDQLAAGEFPIGH